MKQKPDSTDLTDVEWSIIKLLILSVRTGGSPRFRSRREIINAIFFSSELTAHGACFHMSFLPGKQCILPHMGTAGVWEMRLNAVLEQVGQALGRATTPSAGIIDAQSVKTTQASGFGRGYEERSHCQVDRHKDSQTNLAEYKNNAGIQKVFYKPILLGEQCRDIATKR